MNIRQIVFLILTIVWMVFIFSMSSANGEESGGLSRRVTQIMCQIIIPGYDELTLPEQEALIDKYHYFVRKIAHVTEYAILGILLSGMIIKGKLTLANVMLSWIIGVLYAITDEVHQLFVSERAGQIMDVIIDSFGVTVGVILWNVFSYILEKVSFLKGKSSVLT